MLRKKVSTSAWLDEGANLRTSPPSDHGPTVALEALASSVVFGWTISCVRKGSTVVGHVVIAVSSAPTNSSAFPAEGTGPQAVAPKSAVARASVVAYVSCNGRAVVS